MKIEVKASITECDDISAFVETLGTLDDLDLVAHQDEHVEDVLILRMFEPNERKNRLIEIKMGKEEAVFLAEFILDRFVGHPFN